MGDAGRPGLPVISRLIVVPDGARIEATARGDEVRVLEDLDLLPVQPDQADGFVLDRAHDGAGLVTAPDLVAVGEPARMAGVTVVPLTVRPVAYDAGRREAIVTTSIAISLAWTAAAPPPMFSSSWIVDDVALTT